MKEDQQKILGRNKRKEVTKDCEEKMEEMKTNFTKEAKGMLEKL